MSDRQLLSDLARAKSTEVQALVMAARNEGIEWAAKFHDAEVTRMETQIEENDTYVKRMRELGRNISDDFVNIACRSSMLTHRLSAAAIRAGTEGGE